MKHILPNDNCLTQDQILRYLRDKTSPEEIRAIDRHLAHCALCSDAIEGAMMLDTDTLEKEFLQTKAFIFEKSNEIKLGKTNLKPVKTSYKYLRFALGAAASVAVLAVVSLWIFTKPLDTSSNIASESNPIEKPTTADSAYFEQKPVVIEPENTNKPALNKPVSPTQNEAISSTESKKEENIQTIPSENQSKITTSSAPESRAEIENNAVTSSPSKEVYTESARDKAVVSAEKADLERYEQANAKKKKEATISDEAKYSGVAKMQKAENPQSTDKAIFNRGIQYFQEKDYDKAIAEFNSILARQSEGDLYEKALWYSANAYFQKNNKPYSKTIYQRIVKEQGKYAAQAEVILKNWK